MNHVKNFYESLEKANQSKPEEVKEVRFSEYNIKSFPTLIQQEKNAMVTMMTSRFAEWNRRAKENRRLKPFIMKDMEDEL